MEINLSAQPPFSLKSVLQSHGWVRLAPFEFDEESGAFSYLYRLDNGQVVDLQIVETPDGVNVGVDTKINKDEKNRISQSVKWMLGLDQDFSEFYKLAKDEPKLQHVVSNAKGRILRSPTLFEDVIKTILTTNTAWGGTIRMTEALVNQFGDRLPGDSERNAFPTPEAIAASDEETLREKTRLGYRSPYILELTREITAGKLDLESLKVDDMPVDELREALLAIKGVGNYAVANLLMLLGHYEFLTIDSWALKMVSHEWYDGEPVSAKEVENAFKDWGGWKGLAYWLWDWSYDSE
jgi:3-methyladenine DNA glycosylase/8-oxoguanine DNA glycosylase